MKDHTILECSFETPLVHHIPEVMPDEMKIAKFISILNKILESR